jgi:hypothetical protein
MAFFPEQGSGFGGLFKQGAFQIDPNSTPEMIKAKRDALAAMMPRYGQAKYVGEGLGQLAMGIGAGRKNRDLDKFEGEKSASAASMFNNLMTGRGAVSADDGNPLSILGMRDQGTAPAPNAADAMYPASNGATTARNVDPVSGLDMGVPVGRTIPNAIKNGIFAGESGGDYNALFGFSNRDGGQFSNVRLTDMSVNDALSFASPSGPYGQSVKGQIGRVATPMGAYQVVGTTLRAAKNGLGLTGNEQMTPELQDRIGNWIYESQGTGAWEGYKGPQDEFSPGAGTQVAQASYSGGPQMNDLMMAAQNPWLTPQQRSVINTQIEQIQGQQNAQMDRQAGREDYLWKQQQEGPKTQYIDGVGLVNSGTGQVINDFGGSAPGGGTEFGLTPQYVTRPDGTLGMVQLGKDGSVNQVELPEGLALQKGVEKLDLGTSFQWYNTVTGTPIGEPISKDNRGAARETAAGGVEGKNQVENAALAPQSIAKADAGIALIDSIINDPALPSITGMIQGRMPPLNQAGTDLNVKIEQLQGKAFLEAFESLKGGGAITEREGAAAQNAMARLQRAQSTEAYVAALQELKGIMQTAKDRAAQSLGGQPAQVGGDTAPSGLSADDAELWKFATPEERQAIWGN